MQKLFSVHLLILAGFTVFMAQPILAMEEEVSWVSKDDMLDFFNQKSKENHPASSGLFSGDPHWNNLKNRIMSLDTNEEGFVKATDATDLLFKLYNYGKKKSSKKDFDLDEMRIGHRETSSDDTVSATKEAQLDVPMSGDESNDGWGECGGSYIQLDEKVDKNHVQEVMAEMARNGGARAGGNNPSIIVNDDDLPVNDDDLLVNDDENSSDEEVPSIFSSLYNNTIGRALGANRMVIANVKDPVNEDPVNQKHKGRQRSKGNNSRSNGKSRARVSLTFFTPPSQMAKDNGTGDATEEYRDDQNSEPTSIGQDEEQRHKEDEEREAEEKQKCLKEEQRLQEEIRQKEEAQKLEEEKRILEEQRKKEEEDRQREQEERERKEQEERARLEEEAQKLEAEQKRLKEEQKALQEIIQEGEKEQRKKEEEEERQREQEERERKEQEEKARLEEEAQKLETEQKRLKEEQKVLQEKIKKEEEDRRREQEKREKKERIEKEQEKQRKEAEERKAEKGRLAQQEYETCKKEFDDLYGTTHQDVTGGDNSSNKKALTKESIDRLRELAKKLDEREGNNEFQEGVNSLMVSHTENIQSMQINDEAALRDAIEKAANLEELNRVEGLDQMKKAASFWGWTGKSGAIKLWTQYNNKYAELECALKQENVRAQVAAENVALAREKIKLQYELNRKNENMKILEEELKKLTTKLDKAMRDHNSAKGQIKALKGEIEEKVRIILAWKTELEDNPTYQVLVKERDYLRNQINGDPDHPEQAGLQARLAKLETITGALGHFGGKAKDATLPYKVHIGGTAATMAVGVGYVKGIAPILYSQGIKRNGKTQTALRMAALDREAWSTAVSQSFNYTWNTVASVLSYGSGMTAIFSKLLPSGKKPKQSSGQNAGHKQEAPKKKKRKK